MGVKIIYLLIVILHTINCLLPLLLFAFNLCRVQGGDRYRAGMSSYSTNYFPPVDLIPQGTISRFYAET